MRKNQAADTTQQAGVQITSVPTAENHADDNPYFEGTEQAEFDEWNRQHAALQNPASTQKALAAVREIARNYADGKVFASTAMDAIAAAVLEPPQVPAASAHAVLVTAISRTANSASRGSRWVYHYTSPEHQEHPRPDGSSPWVVRVNHTVTHGTRLGDLRDWLRKTWPGITITETWKD